MTNENGWKDENLLEKNYLQERELSPGLRFLCLNSSLHVNC